MTKNYEFKQIRNEKLRITIGAVILARRNISTLDFRRTFDRVKIKIFDLIFFSNETSGNSVYESKKKVKNVILKGLKRSCKKTI